MNQEQLIKKVKEILKEDFNSNASFLIMQPFFKENTVGLRRDELERGAYVWLLDKEKVLSDKVLYFRSNGIQALASGIKYVGTKFQFPLQNIGDYATIIPLNSVEPTYDDLMEFLDKEIKEMTSILEEKIEKKVTIGYSKGKIRISVGETYDKNYLFVQGWDDEKRPVMYSKKEFYDLVDLINEAKKDLEKQNEC